MQDSPESSSSKPGLVSALARSPLFWALLLGALVVGLLVLAPALGEGYNIL